MSDVAEIPWLTATELLGAYRARSLSPVEVLDALAPRIASLGARLNAFAALDLDRARDDARAAEAAYGDGSGRTGPLAGVPVGVKDLYDTGGLATACGSPMLAGRVPAADATVVARLRAAGAVVVGKTTTHEFAWGLTMHHELLGDTRNPWDPERTPGGSSGGSAAALSAGLVPLALGSDTGGSIRLPAAFCGIVGLKPTFGRVPLSGVWPLCATLDHAGPMARTPADAALLLDVIADPAATSRTPADTASELGGLTVGLPAELPLPVAPAIAAALETAVAALAEAGATVVAAQLPSAADVDEAFGAIFLAEALHAHVQAGLWPDRAGEYAPHVRRRLERAETVTALRLLDGQRARERVRAAAGALFAAVDLVVSPVAAVTAPPLGEGRFRHGDEEIELRDAVVPFTSPLNLLGVPSCALRVALDDAGLPAGVQVWGAAGSEPHVLRAAAVIAAATADAQAARPPLADA
ncbi:MAG TPA: amidase [Solirubrobacteraceae bacterium]|nr:amidase [Solirubrobacteraceae bacterium]